MCPLSIHPLPAWLIQMRLSTLTLIILSFLGSRSDNKQALGQSWGPGCRSQLMLTGPVQGSRYSLGSREWPLVFFGSPSCTGKHYLNLKEISASMVWLWEGWEVLSVYTSDFWQGLYHSSSLICVHKDKHAENEQGCQLQGGWHWREGVQSTWCTPRSWMSAARNGM